MEVDKDRVGLKNYPASNIYVRAQLDGKWGSFDISELTASGLKEFLRSKGGRNPWAEDIVSVILEHER